MKRRFFYPSVLSLAFLLAAQNILHAGATIPALAKSGVLENDVVYLRVGHVEKNLAEEISAAQGALAAANKIAGVVLDLRFADGDDLDSVKPAADLFAAKKLPLAILVNGKTRGAAAKLAVELRDAHDGLVFGSSTEARPDIAVAVKIEDEKKFFENPYGTPMQVETNSAASTNNFLSFVDHTTEADLVREKIKDGSQDEKTALARPAEPQKPFIRDPVLARAMDLIKALAIIRHQS